MYIYIFTDDLLHHLETYFFELTYIYIYEYMTTLHEYLYMNILYIWNN